MVFKACSDLIDERYHAACAVNGDLAVDCVCFRSHVERIVNRSFPDGVPAQPVLTRFIQSLHTNDLLLALACALANDAGWQRFSTLYRKYLADVIRRLAIRGLDPLDLSDAVWIDLFLPDRSGQSRIASYDGRSSLATWLRVIVSNRIINERLRKGSRFSNLEDIPEPADSTALDELEAHLRLNRYHSVILKCFRRAALKLSERDRLILLLRYDQELQLGEIARLFSVHQSTITRQIDRALARLRSDVVSSLAVDCGLGDDAIQECLSVAFESLSTSVSIMRLLSEVPTSSSKVST